VGDGQEQNDPIAPARDIWIAAAIAVVAMLHVFVFSSAFPFFNNVDEHLHFDVVHKYARGFLPGASAATLDPEVVELVVDWGSYEYNRSPEASGESIRLPFALREPAEPEKRAWSVENLMRLVNWEAEGQPVYYWVAGYWWRLGGALGLKPLQRLYWLRWFNAVAAGALVALCYLGLRQRYPDRALPRLGVLLVLALYPNDFQYGINNDVLSPLLGAACFLAIVRLDELREPPDLLYLSTGLLLAAAFLSKYTNLALLALCGLASAVWLRRWQREGSLLRASRRLFWLWAAALVPIALWLLRNQRVMGDPSGGARKLKMLGWSYKPFSAIPNHPLFTLDGWRIFLTGLFSSFWGGEIAWQRTAMHEPWLDFFFAASSLLFLGIGTFHALWNHRTPGGRMETFASAAVGCAVAMLAGLSLVFEFNVVGGPSRALPYLNSGRLIAGVLLPFTLVYVSGIEAACGRLPVRMRRTTPWVLLILVAVLVTSSEVALRARVFASPANWFHAG